MGIIIFCLVPTKTVIFLEIAKDYWSEDFLQELKRVSTQNPRFVWFGDVNAIKHYPLEQKTQDFYMLLRKKQQTAVERESRSSQISRGETLKPTWQSKIHKRIFTVFPGPCLN